MLCAVHLDNKKHCVGCLGDPSKITRKSCIHCVRKNCAKEKGHTHCFECETYPCSRLKPLAKTYREKYGVDLIAIGNDAKANGVAAAMEKQLAEYTCTCGGIICMHDGICRGCGADSGRVSSLGK